MPATGLPRPFFRDSSLAMRNPLFSFVMWSGCGPLPGYKDHTLSQRDDVWRFSVRGGFTPITIPRVQGSTTAVSPQSMQFIPSLGQLAVVDGEAQGLVLIDLYTVSFAHAYFGKPVDELEVTTARSLDDGRASWVVLAVCGQSLLLVEVIDGEGADFFARRYDA